MELTGDIWIGRIQKRSYWVLPMLLAKGLLLGRNHKQGVDLTKLAQSALLAAIFSLALASAAAQTLSGTVTNGTTGKPAVGDEVIIINLANGMDVGGSTKVDSNGKFSFKLTGGAGPHLIRAV